MVDIAIDVYASTIAIMWVETCAMAVNARCASGAFVAMFSTMFVVEFDIFRAFIIIIFPSTCCRDDEQ
jgi:hypothetical protein